MRRSALIAAGCVLAIGAIAFAANTDSAVLSRIEAAYLDARRLDEPTRRFVALSLRIAGAVWIVTEWVAAIYLIRGYGMLRRWFAEAQP